MFNNSGLITLQNIVKAYQIGKIKTKVLKSISLTVQQGELLAIIGSSGSGKSTLMNIIGLLDKQDSGDYFLAGSNIANLKSNELAELRNTYIGFVFQQFNLLPRFTAYYNVSLPLIYRTMNKSIIQEKVMQALTRVGMQSYARHCPNQLSGGQQQRIAIARALVSSPKVILADEPTGSLDLNTGKEIMNLFHSLHKEESTIILITHDPNIAAQCTRCITLSDGYIVN